MEIKELSVSAKAELITGAGALATQAEPSIGLPSINMSDGPHGIRRLIGHPTWPQESAIEGGDVCFPTPSALACSFDVELVRQVGEGIARDCIKEDVQVLLAPGVNLKRTPACGRNFEYFSEDPVLSGEMGAAFIQGVQGLGVSTSLKHFAANNQETLRNSISVEMDARTLRELYLLPFEIAVKKGAPHSVMCAYNKLGAIWCSEHRWLLTELLRGEWGFEGLIVSDWYAVHSPAKALAAGLDLQMPRDKNIAVHVQQGIDKGIISEVDLDMALDRLRSFAVRAVQSRCPALPYNRAAQHALAQKAAAQSMVLLKNEGPLLPLDADASGKIAVFGSFAQKPVIMGGGSSKVTVEEESIDRPLDCIRVLAGAHNVTYYPLYDDVLDRAGALKTIAVQAEEADACIVFLAHPQDCETEGVDRQTLEFPGYMNEYAAAVCAACPKTVVVLQTGGATLPGAWKDSAAAILQMWYAGEGGGAALADILFGRVNPSGKLSETFFTRPVPWAYNFGDGRSVRYAEGMDIGYRWYDSHPQDVWHPFGHGLSYTRFEYADLAVTPEKGEGPHPEFEVAFTLRNTGKCAGAECWQLYVGKPDAIAARPPKALKAFGRMELEPGEGRRVQATLSWRDLAVWNPYLNDWHVESGCYRVLIGASAQDVRLSAEAGVHWDGDYTIRCVREALIL